MKPTLQLTEQEALLRELLIDTTRYIGSIKGQNPPSLRFAGGWVRDKLLGSASHDIDVGIDNMTGVQFGQFMRQYLEQHCSPAKYPQNGLRSLAKIEANPEKSKHLETATTKILGFDIDLVNLRKETYCEHSRNPDMAFGSPEEDAHRRDATINALFFNLETSEVEDFTKRGLLDLERRVLKTPLPPLETFRDDPLRVLRGIRFASRLDFEIDDGDLAAMADQSIKSALRAKISRERIGVELTKMLQGPNPHKALQLLDDIRLYGTIFTHDTNIEFSGKAIRLWSRAYDLLLEIDRKGKFGAETNDSLRVIQRLLLRNPEDCYHAWLLCCFVPWARLEAESSTKKQSSPACLAARVGIKADNKVCRVIDDAANNLGRIISTKDSVIRDIQRGGPTDQPQMLQLSRGQLGLAIRSWGVNWRCCVVFALLTEYLESDGQARDVVKEYASWLTVIDSLDLMNVENLKPLLNGARILQAVSSTKSGPWMKKAMEVSMAWQLHNPQSTDPTPAIAEIRSRREELGINDDSLAANEPEESFSYHGP